jgi:hypothetical protein
MVLLRVYLANFIQELRVGELSILIRLVPLPIHCNLVSITGFNIAVHGIVAHVGFAPFKPLSDRQQQGPIRLCPLITNK